MSSVASLRPWTKYLAVTSHIVPATGLSAAPLKGDEGYEIILHRKTRAETTALVAEGVLRDARVVAALSLVTWPGG